MASTAAAAGIAVSPRTRRGAKVAAAVVLLVFLIGAPFVLYPVFLMKALCFALFACAFNLLIGYVGLVHSAMHSISAGQAICAPMPPNPGGCSRNSRILIGTATAAVLGAIAGGLAIRRQGIYFAMITLALAQMMYLVALRVKLTGGEERHSGGAARPSVRRIRSQRRNDHVCLRCRRRARRFVS